MWEKEEVNDIPKGRWNKNSLDDFGWNEGMFKNEIFESIASRHKQHQARK